jgi:hypothetical protein
VEAVSAALPPRPKLGKRERWLVVAVVLTVGEGIAGYFGFAATAEHVSITLGAIIAFVGGETYRPSGMSKGGPDA